MREIKVWHSTSRGNLGGIYKSGYLRRGSYVTTDSIKDLTPLERVKFLCLDDHAKGECACECKVPFYDLKVPAEGSQTCRGYSQYQLEKNPPTDECSCRCEAKSGGNTGAGVIFGIGVLLAALLLGTRQRF